MGSYGWTGTEIAADWAYDTFSPKNLFRKIIFESFCLVSTPKAIEASINDKTHFTKSGKKQLKRLSLSRLHAEISVRTVDMQLGVVVKIF